MDETISSEKEELFKVLIDLIEEFDRVCQENHIRYYAFGGTLLGAIRHKGFIPWDDDVDLVVPREDYNKLKELAEKGCFKHPYFLQNAETDIGYSNGCSRLINEETTGIVYAEIKSNSKKGIFIDIFPFDNIPDSNIKEKMQKKISNALLMILRAYSRYQSGYNVQGFSLGKKCFFYCLYPLFRLNFFNSTRIYSLLENNASRFKNVKTKRVGVIIAIYRKLYNRKWFDPDKEPLYVPFESIKIPVPVDYDSVLKHAYGDYMVPVKGESLHHNYFYSTKIAYSDFLKDNQKQIAEMWAAFINDQM